MPRRCARYLPWCATDDRAAFRHSLDQIGLQLSDTAFEAAFDRMKELADRNGQVSTGQIRSIVDDVVSDIEVLDGVAASFQ